MEALIGGALLSGLFNVVFDRMASKEVVDFLNARKIVTDNLYDLKTRLCSANKLLSDAEEKQTRDLQVKNWLDELKHVVYEADHFLDKINTEALRLKVEESCEMGGKSKLLNFIPKFVGVFDQNSLKKELVEIIEKLKLLLDQTSLLGLNENSQTTVSDERLLSPLVEESDVCGRKTEKAAIVKLLLDENVSGKKIKVIPIVGMGGIGKTTLARLVYNDRQVKQHFDRRAWVNVSKNFDVPRITKTLLEMVLKNQPSTEDPNKLQSDLKNALREKRFLFVLDNVWCENYELWDVLKSCFESGKPGSKIIVTTRSKIVASNMGSVAELYDLQTIPDNDCWNLFEKHVGLEDFDSSQISDLKRIGNKIVKKCKGLPLAVKSIAGLLRSVSDINEWRRMSQSSIWELQHTSIFSALWLSYQSLSPNLKRCFAYFSMFPKDYEFSREDREKIVLLWMAEGLLQEESGKRIEDVGKELFDALVSRSFFQESSKSDSTLVIHDLLHDMAVMVSGESSFNNNRSHKTRHLLYWKDRQSMTFEDLSGYKCLRTFLALPLSSTASTSFNSLLPDEALNQLLSPSPMGERLRALSLSSSSLSKFPDSFYNVKHLRYLDLSFTKIENVPDSVCLLYNLQTLLLSHCANITQLPTNTCNLINLRHLDVQKTPLKEMPPRMNNLTNLQGLSDFVLGDGNEHKMKELGELQLLHGSLRISGLEKALEFWELPPEILKGKKFLEKLILSWNGRTSDLEKAREVLSKLQPHPHLKELEINGFSGETFPEWVGNKSSHDLVRVFLSKCKNCITLPSFGKLPSLRELRIQEMEDLASIGDEFCGTSSLNSTPFASLEMLTFDGLSKWKEWSFSLRSVFESGRFPSLKHLHLELCQKLKIGLPNGSFPSLRILSIANCRSMEAVFPKSRIQVEESFPSLESIRILNCPKLEYFSRNGLPRNLRKLEIHNCEILFANRGTWGLHRLTSLKSLELSSCNQVGDSFPDEGFLPSNLAHLRIDSFRTLKSLNGRGFQWLTSLRRLLISKCEQLENLPEEGLPSSLSYLRIVQCESLSHRCQRDVGEDWPKIQHIPVIIINTRKI